MDLRPIFKLGKSGNRCQVCKEWVEAAVECQVWEGCHPWEEWEEECQELVEAWVEEVVCLLEWTHKCSSNWLVTHRWCNKWWTTHKSNRWCNKVVWILRCYNKWHKILKWCSKWCSRWEVEVLVVLVECLVWDNRCNVQPQANQFMVKFLKSRVLCNSRKLSKITKALWLTSGLRLAHHACLSNQSLNRLAEETQIKTSFSAL